MEAVVIVGAILPGSFWQLNKRKNNNPERGTSEFEKLLFMAALNKVKNL